MLSVWLSLLFSPLALAMVTNNTVSSFDLLQLLDTGFSEAVAAIKRILFFEIAGIPFILVWILLGGIFFTLRLGAINLRGVRHAIDVVRGKYDEPHEENEGTVSQFQAMTTALSGTVGLGNIAGAAIALQLGGPGAILWMSLAGVLGMSSKFVECTLAQKYRLVRAQGAISGGPMYYLSLGLADLQLPRLGKVLAVAFALFCVAASFGAGNMFQVNQSGAALAQVIPVLSNHLWVYGLLCALLVGLVILGGIRRIGSVTESLVPAMIVVYLSGCFWVIFTHLGEVPAALGMVFKSAFSPEAVEGGLVGVFVQGIRRGAFSNGAGLGASAIAHAASRTKEPVREGLVACLEPLIDTVLICNLTALVVVLTGITESGAADHADGVEIASAAFASSISWFPVVLAIAVFLFAFSTIISWSYYGEQAWSYLFGDRSTVAFKALFIVSVFVGAVVNLDAVLDFSDMMLLGMAFPNLLGCFLLSGQVATDLKTYFYNMKLAQMLAPDGEEPPQQVQARSPEVLGTRSNS